jgi:hypothetical protein
MRTRLTFGGANGWPATLVANSGVAGGPAIAHLGVMRRCGLLLGLSALAVISGLTVVSLWRSPSDSPELTVMRVEDQDQERLCMTVEIKTAASTEVLFAAKQYVQLKVSRRWSKPQLFWSYKEGFNPTRVSVTIPRQTEACRFLLQYRRDRYINSTNRLYRFVSTRFPRLAEWGVARWHNTPWKTTTIEVRVPEVANAPGQHDSAAHNKRLERTRLALPVYPCAGGRAAQAQR